MCVCKLYVQFLHMHQVVCKSLCKARKGQFFGQWISYLFLTAWGTTLPWVLFLINSNYAWWLFTYTYFYIFRCIIFFVKIRIYYQRVCEQFFYPKQNYLICGGISIKTQKFYIFTYNHLRKHNET